jgi:hypothetical protein
LNRVVDEAQRTLGHRGSGQEQGEREGVQLTRLITASAVVSVPSTVASSVMLPRSTLLSWRSSDLGGELDLVGYCGLPAALRVGGPPLR